MGLLLKEWSSLGIGLLLMVIGFWLEDLELSQKPYKENWHEGREKDTGMGQLHWYPETST